MYFKNLFFLDKDKTVLSIRFRFNIFSFSKMRSNYSPIFTPVRQIFFLLQCYREYINDRNHVHMNSTEWTTLTEFIKYLGKAGHCVVDETEKGW